MIWQKGIRPPPPPLPPPTYTYMDQNTPVKERDLTLESGALDGSAILTCYLVVDKVKISPKL